MAPELDYMIIESEDTQDLLTKVKKKLVEGWQLAGPLMIYKGKILREMIFISASPMEVAEKQRKEMAIQLAKDFTSKYEKLDEKAKTLLDINNISIFNEDGQLYTRIGDKVSVGVSPGEVLAALKVSTHCPMDLDEQWFLSQIEALL